MESRTVDASAMAAQYQRRMYPILQRPESHAVSNHRSVPSRTSQLDGDRPPPPPPKPDGYHERQAELRALQEGAAGPHAQGQPSRVAAIDPRGLSPGSRDTAVSSQNIRPSTSRTTDPRLALLQKINTKQELERDVFNSAVEPILPAWPARTASAPVIPTVAEGTRTQSQSHGIDTVKPLNTARKPVGTAPYSAQERPVSRNSPRREHEAPDPLQYGLSPSDFTKRPRPTPTFIPPVAHVGSTIDTKSQLSRGPRTPILASPLSPTAGLVELPGSTVHDDIIHTLLNVPSATEPGTAPLSPNTSVQTISPTPSTPWSITAYILNDTSYASPGRARASSVTEEEAEPSRRDADRRSRFGWTSCPNSPDLMPQGLGIAIPSELDPIKLSEPGPRDPEMNAQIDKLSPTAARERANSSQMKPAAHRDKESGFSTRPKPSNSDGRDGRALLLPFGLEILQPTVYVPPTPVHTPNLHTPREPQHLESLKERIVSRQTPLSPSPDLGTVAASRMASPIINIIKPAVSSLQLEQGPNLSSASTGSRPHTTQTRSIQEAPRDDGADTAAPKSVSSPQDHADAQRQGQSAIATSTNSEEATHGRRARRPDSDTCKSNSAVTMPPNETVKDKSALESTPRARISNASSSSTSQAQHTPSVRTPSASANRVLPVERTSYPADPENIDDLNLTLPPRTSMSTEDQALKHISTSKESSVCWRDRNSDLRPTVGKSSSPTIVSPVETSNYKSPALTRTSINSEARATPVNDAVTSRNSETVSIGNLAGLKSRSTHPRKPVSTPVPPSTQPHFMLAHQRSSVATETPSSHRSYPQSRDAISDRQKLPNRSSDTHPATTSRPSQRAIERNDREDVEAKDSDRPEDSSEIQKLVSPASPPKSALDPRPRPRSHSNISLSSEECRASAELPLPGLGQRHATPHSATTTVLHTSESVDAIGLAANLKDGFAISARYAALRAERSKISAAIASNLVTRARTERHADELLEKYLALDTVNSMIDVCFFQISSLLQAKQGTDI